MAIFLQLGPVEGEAAGSGHDGWMKLTSMSWGAGRAIDSAMDKNTRNVSPPHVSECSCTMEADKGSLELFDRILVSSKSETATIEVTTNENQVQVKYILNESHVSGYSYSVGENGPGDISFSLNFSDIEYTYAPFETAGELGGGVTKYFDLKPATA